MQNSNRNLNAIDIFRLVIFAASGLAVGIASAQPETIKPTSDLSAMEIQQNMSASERTKMVSDATAISMFAPRKATNNEIRLISEPPEDARTRMKQSGLALSRENNLSKKLGTANSPLNPLDSSSGGIVGGRLNIQVGTAFMSGSQVSIKSDGSTGESCCATLPKRSVDTKLKSKKVLAGQKVSKELNHD
jgi:hypothetical protein